MNKMKILAIAVALTLTTNLSAQTFTMLHTFMGNDGANPEASLMFNGDTLYGTTSYGGQVSEHDGTVFKINPDGSSYKMLKAFDHYDSGNYDGEYADSSLVSDGSSLYGTTIFGGYTDCGIIFKLNISSTNFTVLKNFSSASYNNTNSDGIQPGGNLILLENVLYGTASAGGSLGYGTLFKMDTDGSNFTTLHNFTYFDGSSPWGLTLESNTLYGSANVGGYSGNGTIFKINTDGSNYTLLKTFGNTYTNSYLGITTNNDGAFPNDHLIVNGGIIYGTTLKGGQNGRGTIFKINTDGTNYTVLKTFDTTYTNILLGISTNSDGCYPFAGLVLDSDTLYGMTARGGGFNSGTIFSIKTNGSGYKVLYNFSILQNTNLISRNGGWSIGTNCDGAYPVENLIINNQTLYGTTEYGGSSGVGTVFALSLAPSAPIITIQPQSQTAQVGSNISFIVAASQYASAKLSMAVQRPKHCQCNECDFDFEFGHGGKFRRLFRRRIQSVWFRHQRHRLPRRPHRRRKWKYSGATNSVFYSGKIKQRKESGIYHTRLAMEIILSDSPSFATMDG